jgi:hypothetical protein
MVAGPMEREKVRQSRYLFINRAFFIMAEIMSQIRKEKSMKVTNC